MAASNNNPASDHAPTRRRPLSAAALDERLEEEISRGERHGTELSCLLVLVENLDELAHEHGEELRGQTFSYIAAALPHELRRFDRIGMPSEHELLIVLPGADGPRGEIVARRVLERVRTIKIEADGTRRPLRIAVGLVAWREQDNAQGLLARARAAAARSGNGEELSAGSGESSAAGELREHGRAGHALGVAETASDTPPASGPGTAS